MAAIWRGENRLWEQPDSPKWTFGETVTLELKYAGPYALCLASAPGRGAIGTGQAAGLRVKQSVVTRQRGGIGVLTIEMGPLGAPPPVDIPLPPDIEEVGGDNAEFALNFHPKYRDIPTSILDAVHTILNTTFQDPSHIDAIDQVNQNFLWQEFLKKRQLGISHYTEWMPFYSRKIHSWDEPTNMSGGNIIETPVTVGVTLPPGFQWLRLPDHLSHDGTYYVRTISYRGSKDIDPDLYQPR